MLMVRVADIVNPTDLGFLAIAAKPVGQPLCVLCVALTSHGQRLKPDQQLLRRGRAKRASHVPQDLELTPHRERPPAELLHSRVSLAWN